MSRLASTRLAARPTSSAPPLPRSVLHRTCACGCHTAGGGECAACAARRKARAAHASAEPTATAMVPAAVRSGLATPGHALDDSVRSSMERGFGHDFSRVRVHSDAAAGASARAVHAHAFTVGEHIVFGDGHYAPHVPAGRHLLAHELTHVVQHGRRGGDGAEPRSLSTPADPSEREADAAASRVAGGGSAQVLQSPGAAVQALSLGAGLLIGGGVIGAGLGLAALLGAFSGKKSRQRGNCPATHTVPDDTYDAITAAWAKSGHGGTTVTEQGGRMVTNSGARVIRTGSGGGGSISLPGEQPGDVTTGTFHTHPYSTSEGATPGISFSGGDIKNFIAGGQGSVKYIGAGTCNFALETRDTAARDACRTVDIEKRWNDAYAKATGSAQEQVETAVLATIDNCGLCYYKACQPDAKSPVPKDARLV